jgi:hypothetical protein
MRKPGGYQGERRERIEVEGEMSAWHRKAAQMGGA